MTTQPGSVDTCVDTCVDTLVSTVWSGLVQSGPVWSGPVGVSKGIVYVNCDLKVANMVCGLYTYIMFGDILVILSVVYIHI